MEEEVLEKSISLFEKILRDKNIAEYLKLIKKHHTESYSHCLRVGFLCVRFGYELSLTKKEIRLIGYAGLIHDLGKLEIPKKILTKKSGMNSFEKKIMENHPRIGFLRLMSFRNRMYSKIGEIIISHHEFKTESYPRTNNDRRKKSRGQKERRGNNDRIEILAQILAIADMYDALVRKRAYKESFNKEKIEKILKSQFTGDRVYIKKILSKPLSVMDKVPLRILKKQKENLEKEN